MSRENFVPENGCALGQGTVKFDFSPFWPVNHFSNSYPRPLPPVIFPHPDIALPEPKVKIVQRRVRGSGNCWRLLPFMPGSLEIPYNMWLSRWQQAIILEEVERSLAEPVQCEYTVGEVRDFLVEWLESDEPGYDIAVKVDFDADGDVHIAAVRALVGGLQYGEMSSLMLLDFLNDCIIFCPRKIVAATQADAFDPSFVAALTAEMMLETSIDFVKSRIPAYEPPADIPDIPLPGIPFPYPEPPLPPVEPTLPIDVPLPIPPDLPGGWPLEPGPVIMPGPGDITIIPVQPDPPGPWGPLPHVPDDIGVSVFSDITLPPLPIDPGRLPGVFPLPDIPVDFPPVHAILEAVQFLKRAGVTFISVVNDLYTGVTVPAPFIMPALRLYQYYTMEMDPAHAPSRRYSGSKTHYVRLPRLPPGSDVHIAVNHLLPALGAPRPNAVDGYLVSAANRLSVFNDNGDVQIAVSAAAKAEFNGLVAARSQAPMLLVGGNVHIDRYTALSEAFPEFRVLQSTVSHPHGAADAVRRAFMIDAVSKAQRLNYRRVHTVGASPAQVATFPGVIHNCGPVLTGRDAYRHAHAYSAADVAGFNQVSRNHTFQCCDVGTMPDLTLSLFSAHDISVADFALGMIRTGSCRAWIMMNVPVPFLDKRVTVFTDELNGFRYERDGDRILTYFTDAASAGYANSTAAMMSWCSPLPIIDGYHVSLEEQRRFGTTYWFEVRIAAGKQEVMPTMFTTALEDYVILPIIKPYWRLRDDLREDFVVPARRFRALVSFVATLNASDRRFEVVANKLRGQMSEVRIGKNVVERRLELNNAEFFSLVGHACLCFEVLSRDYEQSMPRLKDEIAQHYWRHGNFFQRYSMYLKDLFTFSLSTKRMALSSSPIERLFDTLFGARLDQQGLDLPYSSARTYRLLNDAALEAPSIKRDSIAVAKFASNLVPYALAVAKRYVPKIRQKLVPGAIAPAPHDPDLSVIPSFVANDEEVAAFGFVVAAAAQQLENSLPPEPPVRAMPAAVPIFTPVGQVARVFEEPTLPEDVSLPPSRATSICFTVPSEIDPPLPAHTFTVPSEIEEPLPVRSPTLSLNSEARYGRPKTPTVETPSERPVSNRAQTVSTQPPPVEGELYHSDNVPSVVDPAETAARVNAFVADQMANPPVTEKPSYSVSLPRAEDLSLLLRCDAPFNMDGDPFVPDGSNQTADFINHFPSAQALRLGLDNMRELSIVAPCSGLSLIVRMFAEIIPPTFEIDKPACPESVTVVEIVEGVPVERKKLVLPENTPPQLIEHISKFFNDPRVKGCVLPYPVCVLTGVPGAGKSSALRSALKGLSRVHVVTPSGKLAIEWRNIVAPMNWTASSQHTLPRQTYLDAIIMDEIYSYPRNVVHAWLSIAAHYRAKVFFAGDPFQQASQSIDSLNNADSLINRRRINITVSNTMPLDAFDLFVRVAIDQRVARNGLYQTRSNVDISLRFQDHMNGVDFQNSLNLKLRKDLPPPIDDDSITWFSAGEAQGARARQTVMIIPREFKVREWLWHNRAQFGVLVSRHSERMTFIGEAHHFDAIFGKQVYNRMVVDGIRDAQNLNRRMLFPDDVDRLTRLGTVVHPVVNRAAWPLHLSKSTFEVLYSFARPLGVSEIEYICPWQVPAMSEIQGFVYKHTNFDSFKDHEHAIDFVADKAGRLSSLGEIGPLRAEKRLRNCFDDAPKLAEIQVASSRFEDARNIILRQFTHSKRHEFFTSAFDEGRAIFNRFVECYVADSTAHNISAEHANLWLDKREETLLRRIDANPFLEDGSSTILTAFLKTQTKAKPEPGYAAGQNYGQQIISNGAEYSAVMGPDAMPMYERFAACLRDDVIADYGMTTAELNEKLIARGMLDLFLSGEDMQIDVERQDSSHGPGIVVAFVLMLIFLGADPDYAMMYFHMRSEYAVKSLAENLYRGKVSFNLPSGDPFTLLANIYQMLCVLACRWKETKTAAILQKGDDAEIYPVLKTPYRWANLPSIKDVKLKIDVGIAPYHAGRFITRRGLIDDPVRIVLKHLTRLAVDKVSTQEYYSAFLARSIFYSEEDLRVLHYAVAQRYAAYDSEDVDLIIRFVLSMRRRKFFFDTSTAPIAPLQRFESSTDCAAAVVKRLLPGRGPAFYSSFNGLTQCEFYDRVRPLVSLPIVLAPHNDCIISRPGLVISPTHAYLYY